MATTLDGFPDLPESYDCEGYEWMARVEKADNGWYVKANFGADGWDLGSWPYQIVAVFSDHETDRYAIATYTEGDISATRYPNLPTLDSAIVKLGIWYLKNR